MKNPKNVMIANFMEVKPNRGGEYEMYDVLECIPDELGAKHYYFPNEMEFDTNWEWLMPVVDLVSQHAQDNQRDHTLEMYMFMTNDITAVYINVLEYIKTTL